MNYLVVQRVRYFGIYVYVCIVVCNINLQMRLFMNSSVSLNTSVLLHQHEDQLFRNANNYSHKNFFIAGFLAQWFPV
jgi:hypothetical protein